MVAEAPVLDTAKEQIQSRITELEPLVDEHARLVRALDAIEGRTGPAPRRAGTGQGPGRPRGGGERAKQALAVLRAHEEDGISAADVAREIGVHPNYAYRILPGLEEQGKAAKRDRLWYPVDQAGDEG